MLHTVEAQHGLNAAAPSRAPLAADQDLRAFIRALDQAGLLVRVKESVHWKFEIGRRTRATRKPLLFESVLDYPGQSVFTNGLCDLHSLSLVLGMDPGTSWRQLVAEAARRVASPCSPVVAETSPLLENIVLGTEIDLTSLPVPHWTQRDAGRYLGTWHLNLTKDQETGARNAGVYRMQLLGPRQATVSAYPGSHLWMHAARAEQAKMPLPLAVAIGVPEPVLMAASAGYPPGKDEFELAGALLQAPLKLIRCRTVDLEVPALSEIVVEGYIHPGVRVQDGPFLDFLGLPNTNPQAFLFEATGLMFRNHPIFRGASVGTPGAEDHQLFALLAALDLLDFHGNRWKQKVWNLLLRHRLFRTFQQVSRLRARLQRRRQ